MIGLEWVAWGVVATTAFTLALLIPFALHRLLLLRAARRQGRRNGLEDTRWEDPLPIVTVQLPLYNEAGVVNRLLAAVGRLDYPRDRLEVQVLDDSTDETRERVARGVGELRATGVAAEHIHREERSGFKAGALEAGRRRAEGEFILILDADFVPQPSLIRELLHSFVDPRVGMVQARWDHLNEHESLLTRCQAILLDGHFFFEQGGRFAAGRFMSFNGTAGMWRAEAIESAGGWSATTLTEDLDLSYRAQMEGWQFVFRPDVGVPAELPSTTRGLEVQQQRWAKGGIQTARKLLGRLWTGGWPLGIRLEGTVHLLGHLAHPLTVLLGVLLLPSAIARRYLGLDALLALDLLIFASATLSFLVFYVAAGRMRNRRWRRVFPNALAALVLGVGLTAPVSLAVLRGIRGGEGDPFIRTPKTGRTGGEPMGRVGAVRAGPSGAERTDRLVDRRTGGIDGGRTGATVPATAVGESPRYQSPAGRRERRMQAGLSIWMAGCLAAAIAMGFYGTVPLLLLFGAGWGWLAWAELASGTRSSPALSRSRAWTNPHRTRTSQPSSLP